MGGLVHVRRTTLLSHSPAAFSSSHPAPFVAELRFCWHRTLEGACSPNLAEASGNSQDYTRGRQVGAARLHPSRRLPTWEPARQWRIRARRPHSAIIGSR